MGYWEGIVPCEGGETQAQVAQKSCGCPWIPGSVQGQAGRGLGQPGIAHGGGVGTELCLRFLPTQAILCLGTLGLVRQEQPPSPQPHSPQQEQQKQNYIISVQVGKKQLCNSSLE